MTRPVVAGPDGSGKSLAAAGRAAGEALRRGPPLRPVHAREGPPEDGTPTELLEPRRAKRPGEVVHADLHEEGAAHVLRTRGRRGRTPGGGPRRRRRAASGARTGPVVRALLHHMTQPVVLVPRD
jgi:nucleotide-binding universal stress UspA family protein